MSNALLISERWTDGNPEKGLSNAYSILFKTIKQYNQELNFNILHMDECFLNYKVHIDSLILKILEKQKLDYIIFMYLGNYDINPTLQCLKTIKDYNKDIKFCHIWNDTAYDWAKAMINGIGNLSNLHVLFDHSEFAKEELRHLNAICLCAPLDLGIFSKKYNEKLFDISFVGSIHHQERMEYINYLIQNNIKVNVIITDKQRLAIDEYAKILCQSKIVINFGASPGGFDQLKGRVLETMACGTCLFERTNKITADLFTPGEDYIEFFNKEDLLSKVLKYIGNDSARENIANSGYNKYIEKYSSNKFWEQVFNNL